MRNQNSCISIQHVFKQFGKHEVLKDINLEIEEGEIFGLLGPSGAGKSTLIKELAGLDVPTSGENYMFGERMPTFKLMERIGYMAQADALYEELSANENLQFFASLYGLKGKKKKEKGKN